MVGDEECILLNKLEEEPEIKARPARGMGNYDKEFYKEYRNSDSVDIFLKVADEIEALIKRKGWNLQRKFNKHYVGFKSGFPNVFGFHWVGSKSLEFFFKMPATKFQQIKKLSPHEMEYDERWKQGTIRYTDKTTLASLEAVFEATYDLFMENK